ncbi:WD-40 repeat-containing protein-like protein [Phaeosphaeriaceae sp. PMI808]|nr:WD-40 repeat-containing protein-like protein [Phaeosphaeriaceae sp. PMI808]
MSSIQSLVSFKLDLPPSCIEFFPLKPEYAVIGTYNLEKQGDDESASPAPTESQSKKQQRNGSLVLVRVNGNNVDILQNLSTPSAILDIHFLPHVPSSNFGVATSTGSFAIYELASWERNPEIKHIKTIQFFAENVLVTAFSWHPESFMVGMTLSDGKVCLGVIDADDDESKGNDEPSSMQIGSHDLEAWTLAFLPDASGLLSGGDDSALRLIELSEDVQEDGVQGSRYVPAQYVAWDDKKIHGAGVTAILPLHLDDESSLVVTGSYDDRIRLLRVAASGRRQVLAETNLGGGVWRLKLLDRKPTLPKNHGVEKWRSEPPLEEVLLLVSCMHAGTRIVKLSRKGTQDWEFEVLAKFEEHKSMNYGSDSQPFLNEKGQRTFITTSFYDRLLCLWRY